MRRLVCAAALLVCALSTTPATAKSGSDLQRHRVERGQVLGEIAQRYGVTVADLCKANHIDPEARIRIGQKLVIPASKRKAKLSPLPKAPPGASWGPFVEEGWRRGYVTIAGHGRSWSGYVIGPENEILPRARDRIAHVMASWRTGREVPVDERLIRVLAQLSDVFGGRSIRIVGGYREKSHARHSRHYSGEALDFSIPGIPNEALRDFLRTLPNVGVGYYPNSTHLHVDVRDRPGYWVDFSRPGQKPDYRQAMSPRRSVATR